MFPFSGLLDVLTCSLALTTLGANHVVDNPNDAHAGLKVKRNGDVQEKLNVTWTTQNIATEWFTQRCKTATIGDIYEAFLSGTGHTPTGSALDTWITVNADLEWLLDQTFVGSKSFSGTLQIREITNPSNIVNASATIGVTVQSP